MRTLLRFLVPTVILALTGCGSSELHTLNGKVDLQGSSDFTFSGDVLELRLEGNQTQRAFGQIESDGSFRVETLEDGKIASGIRPGVYQGRIVLSDDDPQHAKIASQVIHRKFTKFETSGIKIEVPSNDVVVQISANNAASTIR